MCVSRAVGDYDLYCGTLFTPIARGHTDISAAESIHITQGVPQRFTYCNTSRIDGGNQILFVFFYDS